MAVASGQEPPIVWLVAGLGTHDDWQNRCERMPSQPACRQPGPASRPVITGTLNLSSPSDGDLCSGQCRHYTHPRQAGGGSSAAPQVDGGPRRASNTRQSDPNAIVVCCLAATLRCPHDPPAPGGDRPAPSRQGKARHARPSPAPAATASA